MLTVKPALRLWSAFALGLLAGCLAPASTAPAPGVEQDCRFTLRHAAHKRLVRYAAGGTDVLDADCERFTRCATGAVQSSALLTAGGTLRVTVGGQVVERPVRADPRLSADGQFHGVLVLDRRAVWVEGEQVHVLVASGIERYPLPGLDAGEAVADVQVIDDDERAMLIGRAGSAALDVQRAVSLRAGAGLGPLDEDAVPLVREQRLWGWLQPGGPTGWSLFRLTPPLVAAQALSLDLRAPRTTRPLDDGSWVEWEMGVVRVTDGARADTRIYSNNMLVERVPGMVVIVDDGRVTRASSVGFEELVEVTAAQDFAGTALARGARRTRWMTTPVGDTHIGVIERLQLPGCRSEDRVHLVDVEDGAVRTVARGEGVRLHPTQLDGALAWVEGEARYTFVGD